MITRRTFTTALSLTGLAALAGASPLWLAGDAFAQSKSAAALAADVAKPGALPDMALGPKDAAVTVTEYASLTCSHCGTFALQVFPKLKAAYIDTGKIRYVFREYPLDYKALAGAMLSRCIAKGDADKYFAVTDLLFKSQMDWTVKDTTDFFMRIGRQGGLSGQEVEACLRDQALADKIGADQKYAADVLKVDATPSFFINGERLRGGGSFEDFAKLIDPLLEKKS